MTSVINFLQQLMKHSIYMYIAILISMQSKLTLQAQ